MDDRIEYILQDYKYLIGKIMSGLYFFIVILTVGTAIVNLLDDPALNLPALLKRLEKHAGKKTYNAWMEMLGKTFN